MLNLSNQPERQAKIIVIILTATREYISLSLNNGLNFNCTCQMQSRMDTASIIEYIFYSHVYCFVVFSMLDASGCKMCRTRPQVCKHLSDSNQNERTQVSSSHSNFRRTVTCLKIVEKITSINVNIETIDCLSFEVVKICFKSIFASRNGRIDLLILNGTVMRKRLFYILQLSSSNRKLYNSHYRLEQIVKFSTGATQLFSVDEDCFSVWCRQRIPNMPTD